MNPAHVTRSMKVALAVAAGFFGAQLLLGVIQVFVMREYDPLLGGPVQVFALVSALSAPFAAAAGCGAFLTACLAPAVVRAHSLRMHVVSVIVGAIGFGLSMALEALRSYLDDSLI